MQPSASELRRLAAKLFSVFALAVIAFGISYWLLSGFSSHGIKGSQGAPTLLDCLYFSVVTVSTLGYGDMVPLGFSRFVVSIEAIFGLAFVGYAISQVLSARHEALIEYLANDRVVQTYDECLAKVTDAKELIGDRRRAIQARVVVDPTDFIYNRANPFFPALRALEMLNGYTAHVEAIGRADALAVRVERAAHHVEELASFSRKYTNLLASANIHWRTPRTRRILGQLCDAIDKFAGSHVIHTRFAKDPYKGGGLYGEIVENLTRQIRAKI